MMSCLKRDFIKPKEENQITFSIEKLKKRLKSILISKKLTQENTKIESLVNKQTSHIFLILNQSIALLMKPFLKLKS